MKLTDNQLIILQALARFKFLSSKQLIIIFYGRSLSGINADIRVLKGFKCSLIKSLDFGVVPGKGRLSKIHYLTKAGKSLLINECHLQPGNIQLPGSSSTFFQRDYCHRLATIDFNIHFQQWIATKDYQFISILIYFNKKHIGEKFVADTQIIIQGKVVEPDAIGLYKVKLDSYCFFFEQHNGKNAKRAIKQIENYCLGLTYGIKSKKGLLSKPNVPFHSIL